MSLPSPSPSPTQKQKHTYTHAHSLSYLSCFALFVYLLGFLSSDSEKQMKFSHTKKWKTAEVE
jgi:hypothetical protein